MTGEDRELFDDDETTDDEVTEGRELLEYTKRIVDRNRKRGHANFWNAGNEDQGLMEVNATKDWAKEMNKRGWQINMGTIQKNAEIYPDCLAEMPSVVNPMPVMSLPSGAIFATRPMKFL